MRNPHKVRYPHTFRNEMTTLAQNAVSFFSKYTDESPLIKACRNSGRGNANYAIILMHLKCCFWLPPPGNEELRVLRLVWAVCALLRGRHLSTFFKCPIWFHSHDKLLWSQCPYAPSFYNKTPRHREVTQWRGRTGDPELSTRLQISAREHHTQLWHPQQKTQGSRAPAPTLSLKWWQQGPGHRQTVGRFGFSSGMTGLWLKVVLTSHAIQTKETNTALQSLYSRRTPCQ